jgi:polyhydroxybutyrate depolymerase
MSLVCLLTSVLALAACGSTDDDGEPGTTGEPTPAAASSEETDEPDDVGTLHDELPIADRSFDLYVPDSLAPDQQVATIITFHGMPSAPANVMRSSELNILAEEQGFLVAYPIGTNRRWEPDLDSPDIDFVAALIDELIESWNADPAKIFVAGHSNGGDMAIAAALSLPDRIAAAAPVTPSDTGNVSELVDELAAPTDVVGFIGESDSRAAAGLALLESWRAGADCGDEHVDEGADLTTHTWTCGDGATFTVHVLARQGHAWFGGAERREPLWASESMWEFFQNVTR